MSLSAYQFTIEVTPLDKYEYKIRAEEIKTLISQKKYVDAAKVADTIDWTRVKSVMMLCTVSDVYKVNRRFEDAKLLLEMANERHPSGRMIIYSLCDLSIRMGDVVHAIEYYKDFVQVAPNDSGRYVLQYKLYEAQDVGLEERIAVLEELKKKDYREKWAYELAYLYHRVGLATKCVEECDELILWFGDGKYVMKAMELKTLHQPLSPSQQRKFDAYMMRRQGLKVPEELQEEPAGNAKKKSAPNGQEMDIQVKTMDVGKYNTINLQKELAASMQELMQEGRPAPAVNVNPSYARKPQEEAYAEPAYREQTYAEPVYAEQSYAEPDHIEPGYIQSGNAEQIYQEAGYAEAADEDTVYAGAAGQPAEGVYAEQNAASCAAAPETVYAAEPSAEYQIAKEVRAAEDGRAAQAASHAQTGYENYLSQEYDGQIGMVVPEGHPVERQITGQMNIEDIMREWEQMKRENEERRRQELKQRVQEQTGALFRDFDETSRKGMLERLQKEERIPVDRRNRNAGSVISAHTKIWAAEEVKNALKAAAAAAAVAGTEKEPEAAKAPAGLEMPVVPEVSLGSERAAMPEARVVPETPAVPETIAPSGKPAAAKASSVSGSPSATEASAAPEDTPVAEIPAVSEAPVLTKETDGAQQRAQEPVRGLEEGRRAETETVAARAAATEKEEPETAEAPQNPDPEERLSGAVQPSEDAPETEGGAASGRKAERASGKQKAERPAGERGMSSAEKRLFAPFVPTKGAMKRLVAALDQISLAAYTGNLIITGEPGAGTLELAKNVVKDLKAKEPDFSGRIAKITGSALNASKKSPAELVEKLAGGVLMVEKAGEINEDCAKKLMQGLNQERWGILVILMDTKRRIRNLMEENPDMASFFNASFDVEALDNSTLVAYGCQYARMQEYAIDELGRLALHTRIEDMQTSDHIVTVKDVREIVDEAIDHAERKTPKHLMDVLLSRRYDDNDMIILHEADFI